MVQATLLTLLFFGVGLALTAASLTYDILEKILNKDVYNRFEAPGLSEASVPVKVGAYINWLSVDEQSRTVKMSLYFRQRWSDNRLRFDDIDTKFSAIRMFYPEAIWLPDTFFTNVLEPVQRDHRLLRLDKYGSVWYVQRLFATFPLYRNDSNVFAVSLRVESFGYTADVLTYEPMDSPVDYDPYIDIPSAFALTQTEVVDCSQMYTTGTYPCLEFRIYLTKRS